MKWHVKGIDRTTGADRTETLEADDETSAAKLAGQRGMFIEAITPLKVTPPVMSQPQPESTPHASAVDESHSESKAMQMLDQAITVVANAIVWTIFKFARPFLTAIGLIALVGVVASVLLAPQSTPLPVYSPSFVDTPPVNTPTLSNTRRIAMQMVRYDGPEGGLTVEESIEVGVRLIESIQYAFPSTHEQAISNSVTYAQDEIAKSGKRVTHIGLLRVVADASPTWTSRSLNELVSTIIVLETEPRRRSP